jgi:hypothetical protein
VTSQPGARGRRLIATIRRLKQTRREAAASAAVEPTPATGERIGGMLFVPVRPTLHGRN